MFQFKFQLVAKCTRNAHKNIYNHISYLSAIGSYIARSCTTYELFDVE